MRSPSCLLIASLLASFAIGCGDEGGSTPDAGPPPIDQCTNGGDLGIITGLVAMTDGGLPDGGLPDGGFPDGGPYPTSLNTALGRFIANTCSSYGKPCFSAILNETGVEACLTSCIMGTAGDGLSPGCVDCWVETVPCSTENCITQCAADINSPLCNECFLTNCAPRVVDCTGLPFAPAP